MKCRRMGNKGEQEGVGEGGGDEKEDEGGGRKNIRKAEQREVKEKRQE